jgi:hypothetical protein
MRTLPPRATLSIDRPQSRVSDLEAAVLRLRDEMGRKDAALETLRNEVRLSSQDAAEGAPPGVSLREIIRQGGLRDKVAGLESTLSRLQEEMRLKDAELVNLRRELDAKSPSQDFQANWAILQARLNDASGLRSQLDVAVSNQQRAESLAEAQRRTIDELAVQVQGLKDSVVQLKTEISLRWAAQAAAPAVRAAAMALSPIWALVASIFAALACTGAYLLGKVSQGPGRELPPAMSAATVPARVAPAAPAAPIPPTAQTPQPVERKPPPPQQAAPRQSPVQPEPPKVRPIPRTEGVPPKAVKKAPEATPRRKPSAKELTPEELDKLLDPKPAEARPKKKPGDLSPEELNQLLSPSANELTPEQLEQLLEPGIQKPAASKKPGDLTQEQLDQLLSPSDAPLEKP